MNLGAWNRDALPAPLLDPALTFSGFLDLEWVEMTSSSAHVQFVVRDNLKQPMGLLHGGVYPAVAETIASVATLNAVWRDGMGCSGLNNSASFLRPITAGVVRVDARLRHQDEREWLWSHEFRDDSDRLCALADVTIAVRPVVRSNQTARVVA
jgi:1,4-dihydroxy-2-naphthoyl-CoA hydrolase